MLDLNDFEPGPLSRVETQQHRVLWAERLINYEQGKAWFLWLKIASLVFGTAVALTALWTFTHGVK